MTYEEALDYMESIGKAGSVMGLDSIRNLMRELSDVQEELSILHLAGTNGKGSVGAFLDAALREAGYRVGRYTSPAVFSPLEVWQVDGVSITREEYVLVLSQVKSACDILLSKGLPQPTAFEVETAIAFLWFYRKKCDYVLLETGMGGREDATNLIARPVCSILTSIGMDHMQFLGDTIEEIAREKAGIIKAGCPVVTVRQRPEVMDVIERTAKEKGAPLVVVSTENCSRFRQEPNELRYFYQENISCAKEACTGEKTADIIGREAKKAQNGGTNGIVTDSAEITLYMTGSYQLENSLLALTVLRRVVRIPMETIRRGFGKARWPGRFEMIRKEPLFFIDGAHNYGAAEKLKETLENYFTNRRITYIIGVLKDKEHRKMLELMLPLAVRVYTVTPENGRALSGRILLQEIEEVRRELKIEKECAAADCDTVAQAVRQSLAGSGKEDVIVAWGSLSYLGQVRACVADAMTEYTRTGEVCSDDGQ